MAASPPPPARFENINLLRAFAALSVVAYHVIELGRWTTFPSSGPLVWFRIGWLGVDLFFVISGFVIAYSALLLYRAEPAAFTRRYWSRRLTRILPLYLATLFAYILIFSPGWNWKMWTVQIATHLTFTFPWFALTHGALDGPNWSVGVEMHFYLMVALLIRWLDRAGVATIAIGGVVIAWAWRAAMFMIYGGGEVFPLFVKVAQLPGMLDEFAAGIVLAKLVLDGRRDWFSRPIAWIVAAITSGCVAMAIFWGNSTDYWSNPAMVVMWHTPLAVFLMCVVGSAIALPQSLARRWLRPVDYLGEVSYGIYLWHLLAVLVIVERLGMREAPALLAVMACTIALAMASWHGFEKRLMRAGRAREA